MHHAKWTLQHKNMEYIQANTVHYTYSFDVPYTVRMLIEDLLEAGVSVKQISLDTDACTGSLPKEGSLSADAFLRQYEQLKKDCGPGIVYTIYCELNDIPFSVCMEDSEYRGSGTRIMISSDSFCFDVNHLLGIMDKT